MDEPSLIVTAKVEMDSRGTYTIIVVDYLNGTTMTEEVPDKYIGYLPLFLQEMQRRLGA